MLSTEQQKILKGLNSGQGQMAGYFNATRNPATGNSIGDDIRAGYAAAEKLKTAPAPASAPKMNPPMSGTIGGGAGTVTSGTIGSQVAQNLAASPQKQADIVEKIDSLKPGTGFIETNGKRIEFNSPQQSIGDTPSAQPETPQITSGDNPYNAAAERATAKSENLMYEQDAGIGGGIVSRGLANRAKSFADMGNADDAAAVGVQNSNTNAREQASQQASRQLRDQMAQQDQSNQNSRSALTDKSLSLDNMQKANIGNLQNMIANGSDQERANASEKLAMLNGRSQGASYEPIVTRDEMGGQQYMGAFNKQTGQMMPQSTGIGAQPQAGGIGAVGAQPNIQEGSISTVGDKKAVYKNGQWLPIN